MLLVDYPASDDLVQLVHSGDHLVTAMVKVKGDGQVITGFFFRSNWWMHKISYPMVR